MKSTDPQSVDTGAKPATFVADQTWVGRYLYSSDGKDLGKIAAVKKTGASSDIFFDMGGFLGLGATRKHLTSDQVQDVQSDRIVVRLSEADAQSIERRRIITEAECRRTRLPNRPAARLRTDRRGAIATCRAGLTVGAMRATGAGMSASRMHESGKVSASLGTGCRRGARGTRGEPPVRIGDGRAGRSRR